MSPYEQAPYEQATRALMVWCADWPVVAAGLTSDQPAIVVHANRVVACSAAARAEGIRRGLRRREAQSRCPDAEVVAADADRDARAFEPVAAAVEAIAPRLEIVRPGVLVVAARGPSRYFGGDRAAAEQVWTAVREASAGRVDVAVGVADGVMATSVAARRNRRGEPITVVEPGESAAFLAPHPVKVVSHVLDDPAVLDLVDLLRRLGLRTLGDVAGVPPGSMAGRFGALGTTIGRLARGFDEQPLRPRTIPPELVVAAEIDPPAEQVEQVAFLTKALAAELGERLSARALVCTRVSIEVETEHGETLARLWRHEGGLGPAQLADRARWQLDGWLHAGAAAPTGGITRLRLVPDQVVADDGRQLGFWGGVREVDERASRGVARLQGLLGPDAVFVPERRGGRGPGERIGLVAAHAVSLGAPVVADDADQPWPGHLPAPSPAVVHAAQPRAGPVDHAGRPVGVGRRGFLTADVAAVAIGGRPAVEVLATCGPWAVEERWWLPDLARRRARLQVWLADGTAHLLVLEGGAWSVEATYD
jgi:protein ImuB